MTNASPWWMPHIHADRRPLLLARNRIKAALRAWFEGQDFVEVDSACLQVSPGNEAHLHAFETRLMGSDGSSSRLYLHTSPEFACKKLLAAGEQKIFTFAPVFRNRERGRLHHPEFTMLEWYRVGDPYERLMADCAELLKVTADAAGRRVWSWNDIQADVMHPVQRMSVAQALETFGGVRLLETIDAASVNRDLLAQAAAEKGHRVADDDTWADIFSRIMTGIEP